MDLSREYTTGKTEDTHKYVSVVPTYGKAGRLNQTAIQRKQAPPQTISDGWLSYSQLDRCLCWIVGNSDFTMGGMGGKKTSNILSKKIFMELRTKRRGYQEQDRKRGWETERVLTEYEMAERLLIQKQKCWHCHSLVHVLYRDRYDPLQWSVDRLDNDCGHIRDNIVISCMKCNLRRGNNSIRTFTAVKNTIIQDRVDRDTDEIYPDKEGIGVGCQVLTSATEANDSRRLIHTCLKIKKTPETIDKAPNV